MKVNSHEDSYAYDKLYQLIDVDYYGGSGETIGYDKLGNRTSTVNGSTIEYETNNLNQYTLIDGEAFYTYDDNGNLTGDQYHAYYYDCENRLTSVNSTYYKYDYLGRLVKKDSIKYVYDGDQIIAEYDNAGDLIRKYVYGAGIDEPVMMINVSGGSETKYYYHYDALGSVIALSNASKQIAEQYSYDVFGMPNTTSSVGNPYMFTGRSYDSDSGLYYYRARDYSPTLGIFLQPDPVMKYIQIAAAGRFGQGKIPGSYLSGAALQNYLQRDPIGKFLTKDPAGRFLLNIKEGIPSEINLYTYCRNNPVNFVDPDGLWWVPPIFVPEWFHFHFHYEPPDVPPERPWPNCNVA